MSDNKEAKPQQNLSGFTMEQLQAMLKTVIEEAKKPVVTEEDIKKKAEALEDRRQQAEQVLAMMEAKKTQQRLCSHMRRDGSTRAVFIQNGGYLLCQKCQVKIRPEERPDDFNRLFQLIQPMNFD